MTFVVVVVVVVGGGGGGGGGGGDGITLFFKQRSITARLEGTRLVIRQPCKKKTKRNSVLFSIVFLRC